MTTALLVVHGQLIMAHAPGRMTLCTLPFYLVVFVHGAKPETTYEVVYFIDGFGTNLCARVDTFAAHPDVFLPR